MGNGEGRGKSAAARAGRAAQVRELRAQGAERVVVTVDDTDDMTKATSTGKIARLIADEAEAMGGAVVLDVSRHQLLIRSDVPYTSHNSAMAFEALMPAGLAGALRERAINVIAANRAAASDPGLCVAVVPPSGGAGDAGGVADGVTDAGAVRDLVAFGRLAKEEFIPIDDAFALAGRIGWLRLSVHGGDGAGAVGALAALGLRLSGDDGRFRGRWNLARRWPDLQRPDVGLVRARLSDELAGPVRVVDGAGADLSAEMGLDLPAEAKPILLGGAFTLVCDVWDGTAAPRAKVDLGDIGNGSWSQACPAFTWDNDAGECPDDAESCRNCLYRRWVARGFECMRGEVVA